jgi:glycosyltransferase involved in cell wall biosynthesis
MKISVVIPCYNEEENIPHLYEKLVTSLDRLVNEREVDYEVILINDGSQDGTINKLLACTDHPKFKVIDFRRNYGQTAAMAAGFDHATGDIVIPMDADLQNDPEDVRLLLSERAADIRQTITSRPSFQSEVRRYIGTFRAGWLESFWVVKQDNGRLHFKPHTIYLRKRQYVLFVLLIPAFVVGYLALPAALIFFRRLFLLMPMFVFFIPWSARIGIETRRIVPVHFFIIMLGVLGLCYIVLRFRRVSDTAAKSRLLLDAENGSE